LSTDPILLASFLFDEMTIDVEVALALGDYDRAGEIAAGRGI
jgi:hypothetical protein